MCAWVNDRGVYYRAVFLILACHVPAGHQTAEVHHLMTIKISSCLSLFLALVLCLPSPSRFASSCVFDGYNHSHFARVIHQWPMQTLYFCVLCLIKTEDLFISPKRCWQFLFGHKKKRWIGQWRNLYCNANSVTQRISLFVLSFLPFFRCLFLLLSFY